MKHIFLLSFLCLATSDLWAASKVDQDLFNTVFIENGTFPIKHPELKNLTLGKLLATSLYPESHLEAPAFKCKTTGEVKDCYVSWLSGRYKALTEEESKGLVPAVRNLGAPFIQTNDCARGIQVKLKKSGVAWKVSSAEMVLEMCGGYSDI